jgi:hypothetical protein
MAKQTPLDSLLNHLADLIAERVGSRLGAAGTRKGSAKAGKAGRRSTAGRKLDMSCRVEGCKNRSRGPRYGFICEEHLKALSKKQQEAAREAWNAKHK